MGRVYLPFLFASLALVSGSPACTDEPTGIGYYDRCTNPNRNPQCVFFEGSCLDANPPKTNYPTNKPTESPTMSPTKSPTKSPTLSPTKSPTVSPTKSPTKSPTTDAPTLNPTLEPTEPASAKVCESVPCKNAGFCEVDEVDEDKFSCLCQTGWTGDLCETNFDDCASRPCKNDGVCVDDLGFYKCECTPNFQGAQCQEPLPPKAKLSLPATVGQCSPLTLSAEASSGFNINKFEIRWGLASPLGISLYILEDNEILLESTDSPTMSPTDAPSVAPTEGEVPTEAPEAPATNDTGRRLLNASNDNSSNSTENENEAPAEVQKVTVLRRPEQFVYARRKGLFELEIAPNGLQLKETYTFSMYVRSYDEGMQQWYQSESVLGTTQKTLSMEPSLYVTSPPVLIRNQEAIFTAKLMAVDCAALGIDSPPPSQYTFRWVQSEGPGDVRAAEPLEAQNLPRLVVPKMSLITGQTYTFRAEARNLKGTKQISFSTPITVESRDLQPIVSGAPVREMDTSQNIFLDASKSYDPDGGRLAYKWECVVEYGAACVLSNNVSLAEPTLSIPAGELPAGSKYNFMFMLYSYDSLGNERSKRASKVSIVMGVDPTTLDPPGWPTPLLEMPCYGISASVGCIFNEGQDIVVAAKAITVDALQGDFSRQWTLVGTNASYLASLRLPEPSWSSKLRLSSEGLAGKVTTFRVQVTDLRRVFTGGETSSEFKVFVNQAPKGGTAKINSVQGSIGEWEVSFEFWKDQDGPLTYEVAFQNADGEMQNYITSVSSTFRFFLPLHVRKVNLRVIDNLGAAAKIVALLPQSTATEEQAAAFKTEMEKLLESKYDLADASGSLFAILNLADGLTEDDTAERNDFLSKLMNLATGKNSGLILGELRKFLKAALLKIAPLGTLEGQSLSDFVDLTYAYAVELEKPSIYDVTPEKQELQALITKVLAKVNTDRMSCDNVRKMQLMADTVIVNDDMLENGHFTGVGLEIVSANRTTAKSDKDTAFSGRGFSGRVYKKTIAEFGANEAITLSFIETSKRAMECARDGVKFFHTPYRAPGVKLALHATLNKTQLYNKHQIYWKVDEKNTCLGKNSDLFRMYKNATHLTLKSPASSKRLVFAADANKNFVDECKEICNQLHCLGFEYNYSRDDDATKKKYECYIRGGPIEQPKAIEGHVLFGFGGMEFLSDCYQVKLPPLAEVKIDIPKEWTDILGKVDNQREMYKNNFCFVWDEVLYDQYCVLLPTKAYADHLIKNEKVDYDRDFVVIEQKDGYNVCKAGMFGTVSIEMQQREVVNHGHCAKLDFWESLTLMLAAGLPHAFAFMAIFFALREMIPMRRMLHYTGFHYIFTNLFFVPFVRMLACALMYNLDYNFANVPPFWRKLLLAWGWGEMLVVASIMIAIFTQPLNEHMTRVDHFSDIERPLFNTFEKFLFIPPIVFLAFAFPFIGGAFDPYPYLIGAVYGTMALALLAMYAFRKMTFKPEEPVFRPQKNHVTIVVMCLFMAMSAFVSAGRMSYLDLNDLFYMVPDRWAVGMWSSEFFALVAIIHRGIVEVNFRWHGEQKYLADTRELNRKKRRKRDKLIDRIFVEAFDMADGVKDGVNKGDVTREIKRLGFSSDQGDMKEFGEDDADLQVVPEMGAAPTNDSNKDKEKGEFKGVGV